jgi:hypothetical protein
MPPLANTIDAFLRAKGSPLAGLGSSFVAAGQKYGVDPRLIVGISGIESSFGKRILGSFNAWGWGPGKPFSSWQDGINQVAQGLQSGYISQGLTSPAAIAPKWAPASDGNDPAHWANTVSGFMSDLGGAPAGKLTVATPSTTGLQSNAVLPPPSPFSYLGMALQDNLGQIARTGHADPLGSLGSLASAGMMGAGMMLQQQALQDESGQGGDQTGAAGTGATLPASSQGGGFLPQGASYTQQRADQGRDFQTDSGGAIIAPGNGYVVAVKSDPHGFGPSYPIVRFTSGPYKGQTLYIGHTLSVLKPGAQFVAGQTLSHTGTGRVPIGNATKPGWAEIGFAPGGVPGRFGQTTPF